MMNFANSNYLLNFKKYMIPTSREEYFAKISKPSALEKLIPGWEKSYQNKLHEAERVFKEYLDKFEAFETERKKKSLHSGGIRRRKASF